jgi:hypothetical protein
MEIRRWLEQIGGPNAISIWSWILTLPIALAAGSIYKTTPTPTQFLQWTAILLLTHVFFGLIMWVIAVTLLPHRMRKSRPITALTCFAFLGVARALTLQWADQTTGLLESSFVSRLMTNAIGGVLILCLIAVLVDDYQTNSEITLRLKQAQDSLKSLSERESAALQAADLDVLAQVQELLHNSLTESNTGPEKVRAVSETIVRPISHRLADRSGIDEPLEHRPRRSLISAAAEVLRSVSFPNPAILALIVEALVFGPVVANWGLSVGLANAVLGTIFIYVGVRLLQRYLSLPSSAVFRPVNVGLSLIAVALLSTLFVSSLVSWVIAPFPSTYAPAASVITITGLGLSVWSAVTLNRIKRREEMVQTVAKEMAAVEKLHGEVQRRRAAASDFLHGPIQGQLVASALKGESGEQALDAVTQRFSEYTQQPIESSEASVNALVTAWQGVLKINVQAEQAVWHFLDTDPVRCKLTLDALSEGITNAVRHGSPGDIDITISTDQGRISMTVTSSGELEAGIGNGTGLARLRDRGAEVSLESKQVCVVLLVRA